MAALAALPTQATHPAAVPPWLADLNPQQLAAVQHGDAPLLVLAGAGTGKTATLAARVAALVLAGVDPNRLLLLTFSRRAAQQMAQRAGQRLHQALGLRATQSPPVMPWAGTFHAIGARLLREYAAQIGLPPQFSIIDRGDAQDLMALQRQALGLAASQARFPMADTCLAICSRTLNRQAPLAEVLADDFAWCSAWQAELKTLFRAYAAAKAAQQVLDYDDLLLAWAQMLQDEAVAAHVGARFDAVLVDEYQDTNRLQAGILQRLKPGGRGLTVVGDDAQSIYRFRAAEVGNILGFAGQFGAETVTVRLARNYRSSQPILDASNAVINLAAECQGQGQGQGHAKALWTTRTTGPRPQLLTVADELAQARQVADMVLARREEGVVLKQQAVLSRTGSHAAALELELARRQIPFVKFGGLKFLEAAHIKDLLAVLRWGQNPRCTLAAWRVALLVPGLGPRGARRLVDSLAAADDPRQALAGFMPPPAARADWPALLALVQQLQGGASPWPAELEAVRAWYTPQLQRLHGDSAAVRQLDLDQLQRLAALQPGRERFLTELTLDPPEATSDEAGVPHQDEDYLILSTIHAAKGQEWDAVTVLNVIDGCMPADLATGSAAAVAEERRLLYVAMTRAKQQLTLMVPLRFHVSQQHRHGDRHLYGGLSRFIPPAVAALFDRVADPPARTAQPPAPAVHSASLPPRPEGAPALLQLGRAWD
jgi:DNA helicase-2/ATP-dependent DNA helicase PcrA